MCYCLSCAGEGSMAMASGKFKLNFFIILRTLPSHKTIQLIYTHILANLSKIVYRIFEHVDLPYSPENFELLEDLYEQVSHSCPFEVECQWCYCNTYCTPPIS